jgi:hypothetical protein
MDLNSGKVKSVQVVTPILISKTVIEAVHSLAKKQKMKPLNFTNRKCFVFYPVDWTAGVDYQEENKHKKNSKKKLKMKSIFLMKMNFRRRGL